MIKAIDLEPEIASVPKSKDTDTQPAEEAKTSLDSAKRGKQKTPRLRCAIYTRKSTEEGLNQDFNSLDAQREACSAFIASQSSLGWKLSPNQYDDGGISGGTMDRPALKQLLEDIRRGLIDIIVVYKIDRLTRSLMDFAKMVDLFDEKGISFVSVTQQFNTTTSMGRLTLNVLLSFAQFEREVTAERIKDKIEASKRKGMWMGGVVPLGYKNEDKRLVIDNGEAKTVRWLFEQYLEQGSVQRLSEQARNAGLTIRTVRQKNGLVRKTRPFGRGNLYHLLSNAVYIGKIRHKDQLYEGQHKAIIDQELWNAVQERLTDNTQNRQTQVNGASAHLLTGLIFDDQGKRLSTSHTVKNGKRYHYYVSSKRHECQSVKSNQDAQVQGARSNERVESPSSETAQLDDGWRISAKELERPILKVLNEYLNSPIQLSASVNLDKLSINQQQSILQKSARLANTLAISTSHQQKQLISDILLRVEITRDKIVIEVDSHKLLTKALDIQLPDLVLQNSNHRIVFQHTIQKRGLEAKLVLAGGPERNPHRDSTLIKMIANAYLWLQHLTDGTANSIADLSKQQNTDPTEISRFLPLAFLAPDIIEDIMAGYQPIDLTMEKIRRLHSIPIAWNEQRKLFGFTA